MRQTFSMRRDSSLCTHTIRQIWPHFYPLGFRVFLVCIRQAASRQWCYLQWSIWTNWSTPNPSDPGGECNIYRARPYMVLYKWVSIWDGSHWGWSCVLLTYLTYALAPSADLYISCSSVDIYSHQGHRIISENAQYWDTGRMYLK